MCDAKKQLNNFAEKSILIEKLSALECSYLDSKEETDFAMVQLLQAQRELEHYHSMNHDLISMVKLYSKLAAKTSELMSKMS